MDILARYGIKEVADVTFYELDNTGKPGAPVLYLDTLKVSTIEQTSESTEARGGKGNTALISWDFGKEINVTLEDALYSAKSLAIMYGDVNENGQVNDLSTDTGFTIKKTVWKEQLPADTAAGTTTVTATVNGIEFKLTECTFYDAQGKTVTTGKEYAYATGTLDIAEGAVTIEVSAAKFPGTYYVTGDTYARNENSGKDEFFQFIIYKAKVVSESVTLTLEAEGDPTVFSMSLKVLRPKDGVMMRLVQYNLPTATATGE